MATADNPATESPVPTSEQREAVNADAVPMTPGPLTAEEPSLGVYLPPRALV